MRVIQFVSYISYNNISKIFSLPWGESTYENLLNAVVQEFEIPPNEAYQKRFCDINGTLYTRDSLERAIHRSINEGHIPQIGVITSDEYYNDYITSSTSQSEDRQYDQQDDEVMDLRNKVSNLFTSLNNIEDNLNGAEERLRHFRTAAELNYQREPQLNAPTHVFDEPEVDIDAQRHALRNREIKLDVKEGLLLEFENRLKKKEESLNLREIDLNRLRRRFIWRSDILKNREANLGCRTVEVNMQNYTLNKLESILHRLSDELTIKREQLNEHEFLLKQKEAMLDEDRKKMKIYKKTIKSERRNRKMDAGLEREKQEEANFTESPSTSNHNPSRGLSKSFLMKFETILNNRKPTLSLLGNSKRQPLIKMNGSSGRLISKPGISNDFSEGNSSTDQEDTFDNLESEDETLTRNGEDANLMEPSSAIQLI